MDIKHLLEDEFEIECLVRGIVGEQDSIACQLKAQIELEKTLLNLIPAKPHISAYKAPRREIKICGAKLINISDYIKTNHEKIQSEEFVVFKSRILHIINRLNRMSYSKVVEHDIIKLSSEAKQLLETVQDRIDNNEDGSFENLNNLSFEISDDDDLNAQSTAVAGSSLVESQKNSQTLTALNDTTENIKPTSSGVSSQMVDPNITNRMEVRLSENQELKNLRVLLSKQKIEDLIELLNEAVMTKTALLATPEMTSLDKLNQSQIDKLNIMDTPPSRNPTFSMPSQHNSKTSSNLDQSFKSAVNLSAFDKSKPPPSFNNVRFSEPLNFNDTFRISEDPNIQNYSNKHSFFKRDPSTWGLIFHGTSRDPPIEQFLFRVESIAFSIFRISLDQLVNEFCVFLKDDALNWYWGYRQRYSYAQISYEQFRHDLIARFKDGHTDMDIKHILNNRHQKVREHEDFRKFYDEILRIASRLKIPMLDQELIEILRRNMRPGLQLAMANKTFTNIQVLVAQCVNLESMWSRLGYTPEMFFGNKRYINEIVVDESETNILDTSLGNCVGTNFTVDALHRSGNDKTRNMLLNSNSNNSHQSNVKDSSLVVCFNCDDLGHYFKDCPNSVKKVFCHGCGEKGIYVYQCNKCRPGNLNGYMRSNQAGMVPSQNLGPSQ